MSNLRYAENIIDLTQDSPNSQTSSNPSRPRPNSENGDRGRNSSSTRPPAGSQRGPRYERNIVEPPSGDRNVDQRESSPEVQFIHARPRSVPRTENNTSARPTRPSPQNISRTRRVGVRPLREYIPLSMNLPDITRVVSGDLGIRSFFQGNIPGGGRTEPREELVGLEEWDLQSFGGIDMGVNMQGFNLENPSRPVQQPRTPTYKAPSPAKSGFTRDLEEEDVLVCPNCDNELGVGDDDLKRQVWIVKACGHVSGDTLQYNQGQDLIKTVSHRFTVANVPNIEVQKVIHRLGRRKYNHSRNVLWKDARRPYQDSSYKYIYESRTFLRSSRSIQPALLHGIRRTNVSDDLSGLFEE